MSLVDLLLQYVGVHIEIILALFVYLEMGLTIQPRLISNS